MDVSLEHVAAGPAQFSDDGLPEVAIVGRSNVGKSTLINALVGRRKLARTSGRPGKTRLIQFYRVEKRAYLVDLPGFGYAAVGRKERESWRGLVESYLRGDRKEIQGVLILVDARRGPEAEEAQLVNWLRAEGIPVKLAVTKSDKLSAGKLRGQAQKFAKALRLPVEDVAAVSGKSAKGLQALGVWIREWTEVELRRSDGSPLPS